MGGLFPGKPASAYGFQFCLVCMKALNNVLTTSTQIGLIAINNMVMAQCVYFIKIASPPWHADGFQLCLVCLRALDNVLTTCTHIGLIAINNMVMAQYVYFIKIASPPSFLNRF